MTQLTVQGVPVKGEALVEAKAKARVDIDLNQKADHQATVPIVVRVTLQKGAKHLVKNATIATRKAIFHSTVDPSNVDIHLLNRDTTMADSPIVMSMT